MMLRNSTINLDCRDALRCVLTAMGCLDSMNRDYWINESRDESDLILIRGIPGSGKSTLAKQMKNRVHLEADMFFERNGSYQFNPDHLPTAHRWCLQEAEKHLEDGEKVVVSNTFTRIKEMEPYFEMAHRLGKSVEVREATGNYQNIHGVPSETLDKMRARWEPFQHTSIPTASIMTVSITSTKGHDMTKTEQKKLINLTKRYIISQKSTLVNQDRAYRALWVECDRLGVDMGECIVQATEWLKRHDVAMAMNGYI